MIAALAVALGYFGWTMFGKVRLLTIANHRPDLFRNIPKRLSNVILVAIGQKKMFKEPVAGFMHAFIFWGFLVLQLRTAFLVVLAFDPHFELPFIHNPYSLIKDITEAVVLAAIAYAFWRRVVTRPARLTFSAEGLAVLGLIGGLMVSDFLYDAFLFSHAKTAPAANAHVIAEMGWAPIGAGLSNLFDGWSTGALAAGREIFYWAHIFIVLTFLNILPGSKHFHVITSIPNTFFGEVKERGALLPIPDIENQESFGVGDVTQFTWRQYLDFYSCTECGRCQVNCPTTITGKPLNPKMLIVNARNHLYRREGDIVAEGKQTEGGDYHGETLVDAVGYEAIWDCTTCRACSEACPVMIEHVDKIVDMRRHLVLMESNFPKEFGGTLRNLENKGNPWGLPMGDRVKWAEGLDVPTVDENPDAEYIFWVGCAGAYDDRQKKVSRALVRILREAGISFAILGEEEGCTGDPARRGGNEYLFQTMAQANIEVMNGRELSKKKLVTHCPHCFNTIKNEYPQFGGHFEIVHHSQLIDRLVAEGKIKPRQAPGTSKRITYHDSCYISRYNDVYDEPRRAITAIPGIELKEMARTRQTGMCCGAGGARVWMEEHRGKRINQTRVQQAMETQADTIAVACPFCNMMLKDGVNELQIESVKTKDIAELVLESMGVGEETASEDTQAAEA